MLVEISFAELTRRFGQTLNGLDERTSEGVGDTRRNQESSEQRDDHITGSRTALAARLVVRVDHVLLINIQDATGGFLNAGECGRQLLKIERAACGIGRSKCEELGRCRDVAIV